MKKYYIALSAALFAIVGCNKETPVVENEPVEATKLAFNFQVNHPDDTKAVKTAWETGDKIYVFFESVSGEGKYLTLTYNGSAWTSSTNNLAVSEFGGDESTVTMHAVFFPFEQPEITAVGEGFTFKTKSDGHSAATAGLGIYTYYMTNTSESATCTVKVKGVIKTLTGTLNMTLPAGFVQFYIPAAGGKYNADYKYRLSIEGVKPTACVSYNAAFEYGDVSIAKEDNDFSRKELVAAQPMWGYKYGDGIAFSGVIDGTWASATDHIIYLFDTEAAAKTKTVNTTLNSHAAVKFTSVNTTWAAAATADNSPIACGTTLWARFNLGAEAEGSYGWYFAWGDIIPVREIAKAPADYCRQNYYQNTVAYEAIVNKKVSLTDSYAIYDMATAFLGSPWRMPTAGSEGEIKALFDKGYQYEESAIIVNTNTNLSIPYAGYWYHGNSTANKYEYAGIRAGGWSSSHDSKLSGNAGSFTVYAHTNENSGYNWKQVKSDDQSNRMCGQSVRPVRDLN